MGRINSPFLRGGTPWSSRTLVFSFVGYQTREVPIDGRTTVDVTLQPEAVAAEEVVVLRYATHEICNPARARGNGSGFDRRQGRAEQPDVQVSSVLKGNVPGVTVTQTSGQPGETEGTIRIRGTGTLGNANPLILIDGVEGSLNNIASSNMRASRFSRTPPQRRSTGIGPPTG